jgi:predicted kinase
MGEEQTMKRVGILLAVAMIALGSCQKPPQEAINAARAVYETAAGNPDTLTYAPDSLRAAQEKLSALSAELDVQSKKGSLLRAYDQTTKLAHDAQSAANKAISDAALAKEQARAEAESLFTALDASIPEFETKVWAAKRVRGIKLDQDIPTLAQDARTAIADARTDYDAGSFAAAKAKALTIQERLKDGEARINEATRLAKKR